MHPAWTVLALAVALYLAPVVIVALDVPVPVDAARDVSLDRAVALAVALSLAPDVTVTVALAVPVDAYQDVSLALAMALALAHFCSCAYRAAVSLVTASSYAVKPGVVELFSETVPSKWKHGGRQYI